MSDGEVFNTERNIVAGGSFAALISKHMGQTVTIFTSSGGQSGKGFTGVVLSVNTCFVRMITRIGPAPACSLGNACTGFKVDHHAYGCGVGGGFAGGYASGYGMGPIVPAEYNGAMTAGGWDGYPVYTVGSVTDIPIESIVSFVHSAV